MNEHLASLRTTVSRPIGDEQQLLHFLVDVRMISELSGGRFKLLKFYCSWPLHPEMTRNPVKDIVEWLDGLMEGAEHNPVIALRFMNEAHPLTSLSGFRDELLTFLIEHNLATSLILSRDRWILFLSLYVDRIARTPLRDKSGSFKNLDEIRVAKLDTPSTSLRAGDLFVFGLEWFFTRTGVRRLPLVNDVLLPR